MALHWFRLVKPCQFYFERTVHVSRPPRLQVPKLALVLIQAAPQGCESTLPSYLLYVARLCLLSKRGRTCCHSIPLVAHIIITLANRKPGDANCRRNEVGAELSLAYSTFRTKSAPAPAPRPSVSQRFKNWGEALLFIRTLRLVFRPVSRSCFCRPLLPPIITRVLFSGRTQEIP